MAAYPRRWVRSHHILTRKGQNFCSVSVKVLMIQSTSPLFINLPPCEWHAAECTCNDNSCVCVSCCKTWMWILCGENGFCSSRIGWNHLQKVEKNAFWIVSFYYANVFIFVIFLYEKYSKITIVLHLCFLMKTISKWWNIFQMMNMFKEINFHFLLKIWMSYTRI